MSDEDLERLVDWLRATDRPETAGDLIVPRLSRDQPAFAPNVPMIGSSVFEVATSGLYVPVRAETQPMDLIGSYATAEDVLGSPTSVADLIAQVKELCLTSLIGKLTPLVAMLEQRGIANKKLSQELLGLCPPSIEATLRPMIDSGERIFTSTQVVLTLIKLALKFAKEGDDDVDAQRLGPLVLGTADQVGKVRAGDPDWHLELARYGWFYAQPQHGHLMGRLQRLWIEVIPSLSEDSRYVDIRTEVEAATGVPFDTYVALGITLVSHFSEKIRKGEPPIWIRESFAKDTQVAPETAARFLEHLSASREWYAEGDIELESSALYWDFTSVRTRPLIRIGELYAPLSVQMLAERVTDGLFYTVLDQAASTGESRRARWQEFFGLAWEAYVRTLIRESIGDDGRLIPEELLRRAWPESRVCDNLIEYPSRWLLIESVAKRFTVQTIALGSIDDLERDLMLAVVNKAHQIARTVESLRTATDRMEAITGVEHASGEGTRFTPLIVLPGPFAPIPTIAQHVQEMLRSDEECAALFESGVDPLTVLAAQDIEVLLGTAGRSGQSLVELLDGWRESALAEVSFDVWAHTVPGLDPRLPQWLEEGGRELIGSSARLLFGKRSEGDPSPGS